ncbi:hypothetical protein D3C71_1970060 [compost metagenome]
MTASPFLTRICRTMPPSRCWMVLRLVSGSTTPEAIAALLSGANADHALRPMTKKPIRKLPVQATERSRDIGEAAASSIGLLPSCGK